MIATRDWGECETCGKKVRAGQEFKIVGGSFFHVNCEKEKPIKKVLVRPKPKTS